VGEIEDIHRATGAPQLLRNMMNHDACYRVALQATHHGQDVQRILCHCGTITASAEPVERRRKQTKGLVAHPCHQPRPTISNSIRPSHLASSHQGFEPLEFGFELLGFELLSGLELELLLEFGVD